MLALLNHPNIAQVYGLEDSGGIRALVMEFVDGQTLADFISSEGPRGVPLASAWQIASRSPMRLRRHASVGSCTAI